MCRSHTPLVTARGYQSTYTAHMARFFAFVVRPPFGLKQLNPRMVVVKRTTYAEANAIVIKVAKYYSFVLAEARGPNFLTWHNTATT